MKNLFYIFLLPLFLFACGNDGDDSAKPMTPGTPNPSTPSAELELMVEICSDDICTERLPVAGAQIFMYLSPELREDGTDIAVQAATNAEGKFTSTVLKDPEYWIIVQMPQPDGRQELDYIKTPVNTKTFHTVTFTKN